FGFPVDLTALILQEKGLSLDQDGFKVELEKQKARSRAAGEVNTEDWTVLRDEDQEEFVGYDLLEAKVKITRYRKVVSKKAGELYQIVFNLTPFYPEGGGQVGDKGYLESSNGDVIYVVDTKKENNVIVHFTKDLPKSFEGDFKAVVDGKQRYRTACNHSATHLLHEALREVLGDHVEQKGSAVHSKYLRFDFSHFAKLTVEELRDVENFVNSRIDNKLPLQEQRQIPMETALSEGAMALFGEKYGDTVRTIRFGQSIELCGGTHVQNTADIWHFKIRSESAIAAGIRRIEAITYDAVKEFYFENNQALHEIKDLLNHTKDPVQAVAELQFENSELKKQIEEFEKERVKQLKSQFLSELKEIDGIRFLARIVDLDASGLKDLSFGMGQEINNLFVLFGSKTDDKALLACYISKELVEKRQLNAGQIVRDLGKFIQGGGGGQPFYATAGGKNPEGLNKAIEAVEDYIK
ncbi:MAG: alanine--tRNA ligase, partial [Flavobacteriaceae bacterium]|nr:alanine--tRNA ligase [Flavobacteriaceae bacterium]